MFNPVLSEQVDIAVWMVDCVGRTLGFQRSVEIRAVRSLRFREFVEERNDVVATGSRPDEQSKVIQIGDLRKRWQERVQMVKRILYLDGSLDCLTRSGSKKRSDDPSRIAAELNGRYKDRSGRVLDFSWVHPGHIKQAQYELRKSHQMARYRWGNQQQRRKIG